MVVKNYEGQNYVSIYGGPVSEEGLACMRSTWLFRVLFFLDW